MGFTPPIVKERDILGIVSSKFVLSKSPGRLRTLQSINLSSQTYHTLMYW